MDVFGDFKCLPAEKYTEKEWCGCLLELKMVEARHFHEAKKREKKNGGHDLQ